MCDCHVGNKAFIITIIMLYHIQPNVEHKYVTKATWTKHCHVLNNTWTMIMRTMQFCANHVTTWALTFCTYCGLTEISRSIVFSFSSNSMHFFICSSHSSTNQTCSNNSWKTTRDNSVNTRAKCIYVSELQQNIMQQSRSSNKVITTGNKFIQMVWINSVEGNINVCNTFLINTI